jgi:DNA polymerase III epsilon subunit-like protein
MNYENLIFLDFETGSRNPHKTQPTQLAALCIDPRKLEIKANGVFNSYIKPIFDEAECEKLGIDPIQDDALEVTKITKEQLIKAPSLESVWKQFTYWVGQFNNGDGEWRRPVLCGYNIINFDCIIIDRLCRQYGPYSEKDYRQALFHPVHKKDVMNDMWTWTENTKINSANSCSMDSIRKWLGISEENAHNGLKDILDGTFLLKKLLLLHRAIYPKVKFKDSFTSENKLIENLMKEYGK